MNGKLLVRKYGLRCFYCGSPMSAWRNSDGRILQIRNRNADRPWETSGKFCAFVEAGAVAPESVLTRIIWSHFSTATARNSFGIFAQPILLQPLKGSKTVTEVSMNAKAYFSLTHSRRILATGMGSLAADREIEP